MTTRRTRLALTIALLLTLAVTTPALARSAPTGDRAQPGATVGTLRLVSQVVVFRAAAGRAREVNVRWGSDTTAPPIFFVDDDLHPDVTVGAECGSPGFYVDCEAGGAAPRIDVYLGSGSDRGISDGDRHGPALLRMFGGAGNDRLLGGATREALYGGSGKDTLQVDYESGSRNDYSRADIASGGPGTDTLVLPATSGRVWARLDGRANDGAKGAGDNYLADIENVIGALRSPNVLVGSKANNRLVGGSKADQITGGKGRDQLLGGLGNDVIKARDNARDVVQCGPGRDTAIVDRRDVVRGCERVRTR